MPRGSNNEGKIESLPIWAQKHIEHLSRIIREKSADLDSVLWNLPSNVSYHNWPGESKRFLPGEETYRFQLGDDPAQYIEVRIKTSQEGDILEIHGSDTIKIMPAMSNVCYVDLANREDMIKAAQGS